MEERGARVKLVNCGEFVEYTAHVKRQENRRNALDPRISTAAQQRVRSVADRICAHTKGWMATRLTKKLAALA